MTTEIVKVNPSEYGIEESKANELVGNLPQIIAERELLSAQYDEVVRMDIESPQTAIRANELRKLIKNNRTKGIEVWHKTTKDYFLKGGQFVDAIKRKEIAENERMENALEEIENYAEKKEAERKESLRLARVEQLQPYSEFVPMGINLGELSEEEYQKIFNGSKLQMEAKLEAERKAEEERIEAERKAEEEKIAKEKKDAEEREAQRLENERLKAEKEAKEKRDLLRSKEMRPYIVLIRDYNTMINLEEKEYQKELADIIRGENERIEFEKKEARKRWDESEKRKSVIEAHLIKSGYKKGDDGYSDGQHFIGSNHYSFLDSEDEVNEMISRIDKNVELRNAKIEKAKIEKELQDKKDAELRAENDRKEAELKAKKEAEKLAKAPIKKQLLTWVESFQIDIPSNELLNNEKALIIKDKFESFKKWAKTKIESM